MSDNLHLFLTLLIYSLPGMVLGFTLHELMHAVVADRLGDPLPRAQGRLTIDPLTQIDPMGFGLLYAIGFGFARPVQINTLRIRTDAQRALVAFAGPATNLVIAIVAGLILRAWVATSQCVPYAFATQIGSQCTLTQSDALTFPFFGQGGFSFILFWVLFLTMFVNVLLFIFNLIPIPPLDGFQVFKFLFRRVIPDVIDWMDANQQLLMGLGFIALFVLPRLGNSSVGGAIFQAVSHITDVIYGGPLPPYPTFTTLLQALTT